MNSNANLERRLFEAISRGNDVLYIAPTMEQGFQTIEQVNAFCNSSDRVSKVLRTAGDSWHYLVGERFVVLTIVSRADPGFTKKTRGLHYKVIVDEQKTIQRGD